MQYARAEAAEERERKLREAQKEAEIVIDGYREEVRQLRDERDELAQWQREAMMVESEWNAQAVGRALGLTLGKSIRAAILPGILELQCQLAEARGAMTGSSSLSPEQPGNGKPTPSPEGSK